jgi:rSAM/selenodomain-associated transferase 1
MPPDSVATLLIQFARSPVVGTVKTRMQPALTARQACELHCELVRWTSRTLVDAQLGRVRLAVAGDTSDPLFGDCRALGVHEITPQAGEDLGERMLRALAEALQSFDRVLLVGSDCPGMDRAYLAQALDALDQAPLVLGPAADGGYVLVGARGERPPREMFSGIDWGTSRVYAQTLDRLRQSGCVWRELPVKADIDRPEDLDVWEKLREQGA